MDMDIDPDPPFFIYFAKFKAVPITWVSFLTCLASHILFNLRRIKHILPPSHNKRPNLTFIVKLTHFKINKL